MKTMKLLKILPVVLLGLILSVNAGASTIRDEVSVNTEMTVQMESWMFDTNYLSGLAQTVEAWMFDNTWLDRGTVEMTVEGWMLDDDYLNAESQSVEPWMLDSGYLN
jgi:hypothetical protein